MSGPLPIRLDPFRLARRGLRLSGSLPLQKMPRLCSATKGSEGQVVLVELWAKIDSAGVCTLYGDYSAKPQMICQRCLGLMDIDIKNHLGLMMVSSQGAPVKENDEYETYILGRDDKFSISELIEEELLLCLPYIPMHADEADCNASMLRILKENSLGHDTERKQSPFSILERLKRN